MKTLRDIVNAHPEWLDLPVVVYQPDGVYDWLDGSADVYVAEENGVNVLVFAGN